MQSGVKAVNKAGLVLKLFHHAGTSPRHEVRLVPSQMQLGRQITPENKLQKRYLEIKEGNFLEVPQALFNRQKSNFSSILARFILNPNS